MTINKNFKSRPERLKYSKCMDFSLSGLDLKLLFMVTGAYYESGLSRGSNFQNFPVCRFLIHKVLVRGCLLNQLSSKLRYMCKYVTTFNAEKN